MISVDCTTRSSLRAAWSRPTVDVQTTMLGARRNRALRPKCRRRTRPSSSDTGRWPASHVVVVYTRGPGWGYFSGVGHSRPATPKQPISSAASTCAAFARRTHTHTHTHTHTLSQLAQCGAAHQGRLAQRGRRQRAGRGPRPAPERHAAAAVVVERPALHPATGSRPTATSRVPPFPPRRTRRRAPRRCGRSRRRSSAERFSGFMTGFQQQRARSARRRPHLRAARPAAG